MPTAQAAARQQVLAIPVDLSVSEDDVNYGAVFTRRWVVEFILDLVGYESTLDLCERRLVEPACGDGAFLLPIAERVIESCRAHGRDLTAASGAVRAFDLQSQHVDTSRKVVAEAFEEAGATSEDARRIADTWVSHADFLLSVHDDETADFVVGNPPYIRLEDVPDERMAAYRAACDTMSGRADVYLGFFEIGLDLLAKGGTLGFICADRWMRNAYGKRLRRFIVDGYSVEVVVEMHDADAFAGDVSAYPAVTVIRRGNQTEPLVAATTQLFGGSSAQAVVRWAREPHGPGETAVLEGETHVARLSDWFDSEASWPTGSPERLSLLRDLEERFDPLEAGKTRIGIGVATGADAVFITRDESAVEPDRLIPLVMTRDTTSGELHYSGHYLINPWVAPRELANLEIFPRLRKHFEEHGEALKKRHVAGKRPEQWYRTIDPVHEWLTPKPKLLFPDMKMFAHPVLDPGGHYPHHNLYYVISEDWDLEVLGGLLLSKVAQFFIESYAVRMRGGTLRFQAQYLRRIRVPNPEDVSSKHRRALRDAFRQRDTRTATRIALKIYGISNIPA